MSKASHKVTIASEKEKLQSSESSTPIAKRSILSSKAKKESSNELPLINLEENSLGQSFESAFTKAIGLYKSNQSIVSATLDTFRKISKDKYSTREQEILLLTEEWFSGLSVKKIDSRLNDFQISDLESRFNQKIEMLESLKASLVAREVIFAKSHQLMNIADNSLINIGPDPNPNTAKTISSLRVSMDKHFRPRKNNVLMKVDVPGVLEADEQPIPPAVKSMATLPPISKSIISSRNAVKMHRFSKDVVSSFAAEPRLVIFDSFIPYQTVSRSLTIKNISRFSHRLRVSFNPPGSYPPRFSMNIQKTPIEQDGLIAPGLSCIYNIEFTPNSFASTSEELLIVAENGESIIVPILASREKPILTIPSVLDIGYCMEGRELIFKVPIKNEGGEARFSTMLPNVPLGAFEIFEQIGLVKEMDSKPVTISSFTISPSFMCLQKGDDAHIELYYAPPSINRKKGKKGNVYQRQDSQKFRYACDNCDIVEFQVIATVQEAKVDILHYYNLKEDIYIFPSISDTVESPDGQFLIDFKSENFGVPKSYTLTISNPTNLSIPFDWKWINDSKRELNHEICMVPNNSNIFKISPSSGTLAPLSEMTFTVTFLCFESKKFGTMLEMIVPISKSNRKPPDLPKCVARLQLQGNGVPFSPQLNTPFIQLPFGLHANAKYQQKVGFTNNSLSDMEYSWDVVGIDQNHCKVTIPSPKGVAAPNMSIQFEFNFQGAFPTTIGGYLRCRTANGLGPTLMLPVKGFISIIPGQIAFQQDFIDLGLLKLGSSSVQSVPFRNGSKNTIHYSISFFHKQSQGLNCFFKVKPSEGILDPGKSQVFVITYIPLWYQQLRATLEVYAISQSSENDVNPTRSLVAAIDVKATTETPLIAVENPVNYVTCFVGVPFVWTVMLRNSRLLSVPFQFKEQKFDGCVVKFQPSRGHVLSMGSLDVKVLIECSKVGTKTLELQGKVLEMVENSGILDLKLNMEVYEPTFSFSIRENEEAWRQFGQSNFKLDSTSDSALRMDFGVCPIFAGRTRTFKISNHSPFPSPFNVCIEKYTPTLDNVDELNDFGEAVAKRKANTLSARYGAFSETPQLLQVTKDPRFGFSSKGGQQFVDGLNKYRSVLEAMKSLLSDGRGAAFHVVPSSGVIPPWREVTIRVTSYNNLVGIYEDRLVCDVGTVQRRLPVRLAVVGSPVKFSGPQLVSSKKDLRSNATPVDIVNFGTRMISTTFGPTKGIRLLNFGNQRKSKAAFSEDSLNRSDGKSIQSSRQNTPGGPKLPTKRILVENHSPREVKLEWVVYIKHSENRSTNDEDFDLNSYLSSHNRIGSNEVGVIDIYPPFMTILPFKSAILTCYFRNCLLGSYDAIVLADIGYVEGKQVKYGPRRIAKNGDTPLQEPVITSDMATIAIKDHDAIAKLRIQAKCIEPRLSLDIGSRVRIKKALNKIAELTADYTNLSCIQFLVNQSDAVCSFTLSASPANLFSVKPSKASLKDPEQGVYELKQKQQMMITVYYTGSTNFGNDISGKSRIEMPETSRSDLVVQSTVAAGIKLESGTLLIEYSNGMQQEIPLILEGVFE